MLDIDLALEYTSVVGNVHLPYTSQVVRKRVLGGKTREAAHTP